VIARVWSFWGGRTPRECALMAALGAVLAAAAVVVLVWRPLAAERTALRDSIARYAAATQYLASGGAAALARADTLPADQDAPLSVRLVDAATALGLTVRRLDPVGAAAFEVSLEDAPFDAVVAWLVALERDHGLRLAAMRMQRRPAPGVVTATVTIEE
jgi:general secretion pathway protein M